MTADTTVGIQKAELSWLVVNASITRFKFTRDRITLFTFNEHSFLEQYTDDNLVTFR